MKPYSFECDVQILPIVRYNYEKYRGCTVNTSKGISNDDTKACIETIANKTKAAENNQEYSKLIYITHGFHEKSTMWLYELCEELLVRYKYDGNNDTEDSNKTVIIGIVTWERGSKPGYNEIEHLDKLNDDNKLCCQRQDFSYGNASVNIWPIANVLSYLHEQIVKENGGFYNTYTDCIGFGMGAHLCGFFGKAGKTNKVYKVEKIVGLDPAGPIFHDQRHGHEYRLDKDDASEVEIIHTNAAVLGYKRNLGNVDFYINGGYTQQNCSEVTANLTKWRDSWCSHEYARHLYSDLLRNNISCNMAHENDISEDQKLIVQKQKNIRLSIARSMKNNNSEDLVDLDGYTLLLRGNYIVLVEKDSQHTTKSCEYFY